MTYIRNNKALVFIIAILLLSNIALLYFFVTKGEEDKGKKSEMPKSAREFMIQKLKNDVGFDDNQIAQYEQLANKHKQAMKPMFDQLHMTKDSLYRLLQVSNIQDSSVNYYLGNIGERQQNIDQRIFYHFYALREICTAEQRPKFDTTVYKIIRKMIGFKKEEKDKERK